MVHITNVKINPHGFYGAYDHVKQYNRWIDTIEGIEVDDPGWSTPFYRDEYIIYHCKITRQVFLAKEVIASKLIYAMYGREFPNKG